MLYFYLQFDAVHSGSHQLNIGTLPEAKSVFIDNDFLGKKDCNFTMTLSTGLGDPGQIFPKVDNASFKDLVREKEEEIVSEHPGLGNLLRDIVMAPIVVYGSFIEVKLLWRKENLCVQHFTRDGKETNNLNCYSTQ